MGNFFKSTVAYFKNLYKMRYFWAYLVRCDLISRYRRSKMGMLWMVLSPLLLTCIMSVVLGTVFRIPIVEYAPYILIGMVMWDVILSSVVTGGSTFLNSFPYIRQFNHPVTIYTLKAAIVSTINFLVASIGIFIWTAFTIPENLVMGLVTLPLTTVLMFLLSWTATTIAAFTNTKYRDYPQMMALFMQAVWYVSPVFFQESMFQSNKYLSVLFNFNPITHILYLQRKPFLNGTLPSVENYVFTICTIILLAVIACCVNKRNEKKVIFYL